MRPASARIPIALLVAAALGLAAACSGEPPEIKRVNTERLLVRDLRGGPISEKLSVFLVGVDPDGQDDLSTIYIINDEAELFWTVDSKTWVSSSAEGEAWIGTNGISMPAGSRLPAGTYRVLLRDAAGEDAENSFTLEGGTIDLSKVAFPSVVLKDGAIKISGSFRNPEIWVYTEDGRFLVRLAADNAAQPITLQSLDAAYTAMGRSYMFWAYAHDDTRDAGLLSGPYPSAGLKGN